MKLALGLAPSLALALSAAPLALAATPDISADRITRHVSVLASDAFEGRGIATPGEQKTIDYLAAQFKAAGLQPGGDRLPGGKRAWTQAVPLLQAEIAGPVASSVSIAGQTLPWTQGNEVALRPALNGAARVAVRNAPLVFIGYGVTAPERNWDDYKGLDVRGKILVALVNDPDFETGVGDFGGKAMTWYGRYRYKFDEAAQRGALGILVVHETVPAGYGWEPVRNTSLAEQSDIVRADPAKAHTLLEGWIQRQPTVDLFRRAGLDFETLKRQAQSRDFRPVPLGDARLSADYAVRTQRVTSHNVVAVLPGKTHPDEYILYTAHWDHFGVGAPDASGDRIFNGAVDNATGTAAVVELAHAFAAGPRPQRSIVFMPVTGEEQGLLGSEYYAQNPLYPLARTVANLNIDALTPGPPARNFSTYGLPPTNLTEVLVAAGKAQNRVYAPAADQSAGLFYRSDHFSLAKRGLPALSISSGNDWIEGGPAASAAFSAEFVAKRYHQPADNFDPKTWRSDGIALDTALMFDVGLALANSRAWPTWNDGAEFKAERDKTAAQRR